MSIRRCVLAVILYAVFVSAPSLPEAAAQQVLRPDPVDGSFGRQVASAAQQATRHGGSAMVGYGIVVRAPANQIWGMYSLKHTFRPTLLELLEGSQAGHAGRGSDDGERIVDRRAAVLIRLDSDGRADDVHLYTLDSVADFDVDTIWWIGEASREDSFDLLLNYAADDYGTDTRKGAIHALARHGLPERALPALKELLGDSSEQKELRKAAIYGLGMLHTEAARRALLDLIYDEAS